MFRQPQARPQPPIRATRRSLAGSSIQNYSAKNLLKNEKSALFRPPRGVRLPLCDTGVPGILNRY